MASGARGGLLVDVMWLGRDAAFVEACGPNVKMEDTVVATVRRQVGAGLVVLTLALGVLAWMGAPAGAKRPSPPPSTATIAVCCAWDAKIADGITYSIGGTTDASLIGAIDRGVLAWVSGQGSVVTGQSRQLHLTRVDQGQAADVTIDFKPSGGNVQGSTRRTADSAGFIDSASIRISAKAFGAPNTPAEVQQITTHEFGHALGADHANTSGFMMSPTLTGGSTMITACDARAVETADNWYLDTASSTPAAPPATSVTC